MILKKPWDAIGFQQIILTLTFELHSVPGGLYPHMRSSTLQFSKSDTLKTLHKYTASPLCIEPTTDLSASIKRIVVNLFLDTCVLLYSRSSFMG
jgi:hypothetical protein